MLTMTNLHGLSLMYIMTDYQSVNWWQSVRIYWFHHPFLLFLLGRHGISLGRRQAPFWERCLRPLKNAEQKRLDFSVSRITWLGLLLLTNIGQLLATRKYFKYLV